MPKKPHRRQAASHKNGVDSVDLVLFEEQALRVCQGKKNTSSMRRRLSVRSFAEHTMGGGLPAMALIQSLKWCLRNRIAGKPPPTQTVLIQVVGCCLKNKSRVFAQAKKPPPGGGFL
ncbi:hypothetical protein [Pseudomonas triticifolii]|uniref:Uncharacterized protein n=1 Tax=Pseudomonas triticifolii TaxID=2762592 RepID=A0ABR7BBQ4_9PSED|nr:hypothetical protein [Pseudomonas triticifolii]MBC3954600.1 hypothetical protein [Pseudomonas triticifolii]